MREYTRSGVICDKRDSQGRLGTGREGLGELTLTVPRCSNSSSLLFSWAVDSFVGNSGGPVANQAFSSGLTRAARALNSSLSERSSSEPVTRSRASMVLGSCFRRCFSASSSSLATLSACTQRTNELSIQASGASHGGTRPPSSLCSELLTSAAAASSSVLIALGLIRVLLLFSTFSSAGAFAFLFAGAFLTAFGLTSSFFGTSSTSSSAMSVSVAEWTGSACATDAVRALWHQLTAVGSELLCSNLSAEQSESNQSC